MGSRMLLMVVNNQAMLISPESGARIGLGWTIAPSVSKVLK